MEESLRKEVTELQICIIALSKKFFELVAVVQDMQGVVGNLQTEVEQIRGKMQQIHTEVEQIQVEREEENLILKRLY